MSSDESKSTQLEKNFCKTFAVSFINFNFVAGSEVASCNAIVVTKLRIN